MTTISLAPPLRAARTIDARPVKTEPNGFGPTTRVRTLMGWQPVDRLMAGDLVLDSVGNLHELRAIRQKRVDGADIVRMARKGRAPLVLGAGQSMIADDWRAQVIFGQPTASPAARLVDGAKLRRGQPRAAVLFQLEFDTPVTLDLDGAQVVLTPAR
ncbi:Hint domain-containing protein [Roseibaca sp. Y0-43]|uniref:Hint domain-containing protein n=1 Tax=Roseibaca sp. Y0-43 TaxID=2816854 RepID=UPI001D0C2C96|nr:Hint domain-containing protein [Roseibaca sp. Y0-43]MCC1481244.1 hypothetical protein [Roseibaca sp. Y0-43]